MNGNIDSTRVILKCAIIAGFACMMFFPLSRTRTRAHWANCAFVVTGLTGIAAETVSLMLLMGWLPVSRAAHVEVDSVLHYTYGLLLVIIVALTVSGQLRGTKRIRHDGQDQSHKTET